MSKYNDFMKRFIYKINLFCVFTAMCFCLSFDSFCYSGFLNSWNDISYSKNNDNENLYAKALSDCVLYKSKEMSENAFDVYFQIPETYFVLILEDIDDKCYKVKYDRFVGYVKKNSVEIALFVPVVKTLDGVTLDIKSSSGTQIWSHPTTGSEICTTLSAGTVGLKYIASVVGEVPVGGKNNIWYYVSYTSEINSTNVYEGYVYSENVTNLSDIILNTETNPEVINTENNDENLLFISSTIKTIVVAIVAIPVILFFVIILYKLVKNIKKNTNKNKNLNKLETEEIDEVVRNRNLKSIEKYKNMKLVKNKNNVQSFVDFDDEELL